MTAIYEDIILFNDQTFRPRAIGPTEARRNVDWTRLKNEQLLWAHNLLEAHQNFGYLLEVLKEIERRVELGQWLDPNLSPPPLHELPLLLTIWPLKLLHKQRKSAVGGG